jgi:hypothetical protein
LSITMGVLWRSAMVGFRGERRDGAARGGVD